MPTPCAIDDVIEVAAGLYRQRAGLRMVNAPAVLRHFTARFEELELG